jgi:NAD(P)-dependent dehydrogenase (short-subunit alcohol dehydrogenase family)
VLTGPCDGIQTNVKGTLLTAKAFLPTADRPNAAFLGVISDVSILPAAYLPGLSGYVTSKLAQAKIFEFVAAENPDVFVATMHPGMVETDNFNRTGAKADQLPMDKGTLTYTYRGGQGQPVYAFPLTHTSAQYNSLPISSSGWRALKPRSSGAVAPRLTGTLRSSRL